MARQLRENSDVAHALASGAFRRAARGTAPHDPIGVALARVASTMEEIATSAQRVARGDLRATLTPQSPDDAFGQAHAAMMRRITTTLRDVEAARLRIAQEIEAMRDDAAALASASAADADRLRRTVERVSGLAIQVRADAERSESLAQRADDGERLVEEGSATLHTSVHGIREVLQRSDDVQRLARNAGLLAVCAMADAGQVKRSAQATEALEGEARALAAEAAAAARTMTRVMIDGSEKAYESGVAIDRVAGVVHESATMVRELEGTARRRAAELALVDEKVVQVQGTVAQGADRARQLATRLDLLSSHVRQLDAVLRRLNRGHAPVIMATSPATARSGPALYVTPPHAASAIPRLSILAN
jgi:methyl-accepting chemotaxis protein